MSASQFSDGLASDSPQIPPDPAPERPKRQRRRGISASNLNVGALAVRHIAIKAAADRLKHDPADGGALDALCREVIAAVAASPAPRRRGQPVRLRQRAAALLRVYASDVSAESRAAVRDRVRAPIEELERETSKIDASPYVRSHVASVMIGVSVPDLLVMCRQRETRRALGWPRPVGDHVLFLKAALDPRTSAACLENLPADEPWPSSSWPDGWLS